MDDELARAEVYGLLAALFQAAPSPELYAQLQVAVTQAPVAGGFLEHSFSELVAASRRLPLDAVRAEYAALFEAIGKPEVFLYASYFVAGALNEKPLVVLRDALRALGIERDPMILETEDHIACLCEVMRYLIAGDEIALGSLSTQKHFFDTQLRPWADDLWDALEAHPKSDFYRALAAFARDFFSVEAQAFDMLEG
jgi:TorA maturation chaperone TorD